MDLVLVFATALAFYGATLAPTVIWGDSATLALDVYQGTVQIGTASDHPLFVLIGRGFSAASGDVARLVNFEAAVFGALTVAVVYRCSRQLGTSRMAAAAGAAALCVSHAFWLHSVIAEVYTANAFFLAVCLSLLIDWSHRRRWPYLIAAALVFAIGLTNHLVLASLAPAAILFIAVTNRRMVTRRRFLLGLAAITIIIIAGVFAAPSPLTAAWRRVWVGPPGVWEYFQPRVEPEAMVREAAYHIVYLIYQFPSISLPLGIIGAGVLLQTDAAVAGLLLMTVAANAGLFIHHTGWQSPNTAKFVFYIADYVVFSILCAIGTDAVIRWFMTRPDGHRHHRLGLAVVAVIALVPPALYAILPAAANRLGIDLIGARTLPNRDNQTYFLNPNKHGEDGPRQFAIQTFEIVRPKAVIFADFTPYAVLQYVQTVEHVRPDVLLRSARTVGGTVPVTWMFEGAHQRPTYLVTGTPGSYYDLSTLTGAFDLVPDGPIIEVRPRAVH